jgi:hypothetical protein
MTRRLCLALASALLLVSLLSGCAVIAVADAAVTVVATGVKVTGKVVGAAVDVVTGGDDDEDEDD